LTTPQIFAHLIQTNPRLANAAAACLTPTQTATALRIALTIALRLRIQPKMIATVTALVMRVNRRQQRLSPQNSGALLAGRIAVVMAIGHAIAVELSIAAPLDHPAVI